MAILREAGDLRGCDCALVGVSLANSRFNRHLVDQIGALARSSRLHRIDVLIVDEIERVNYVVFRGDTVEKAAVSALARALQISTMFRNRLQRVSGLDVHYIIESQSDLRRSPEFAVNRRACYEAYSQGGRFYDDIRAQTLENISARILRHGQDFVEARLDDLCRYVLDEVALLSTYYQLVGNSCAEFYPGRMLWVRERVAHGEYAAEGLALPWGPRAFVDLARVVHAVSETRQVA